MPGFANHKLGKYASCTQEVDHSGNPVLVFNLGEGRPIMQPPSVDDGCVITQRHPSPKAYWTLYVHTQETVSHTLLSVAVCKSPP